MNTKGRGLSPALFGVALICFVLPFITVSCQGARLMNVTGMQLVTGMAVEQPGISAQRQVKRVGPEILAVIAFVAGIAGLALGFLPSTRRTLLSVIMAGTAVLALLLLKLKIDNDALRESSGLLQIDFAAGYWMAVIFYLAAAGFNTLLLLQKEGHTIASAPGSQGGRRPARFCDTCGAPLSGGALFCDQCGNMVD